MKNINNIIWIAGLAAIVAVAVAGNRGQAQQQQHRLSAAVVVLQGYQQGAWGYGTRPDFVIGSSTSSSNAIEFSYGDNLAQALSDLVNAGYEITLHDQGWLMYTAIRR